MLTYNDLRPEEDYDTLHYELVFPELRQQVPEKARIIAQLLALKRGLDKAIALRRAEENLIVASWNIKEFGHTTQRLPESYFYIAEIISSFDLIAIQEIKSGLADLQIILRLLGDDWGYLVNDITEGTSGNSERSCYIFNRARVQLAGLAGEIVLWDELTRTTTLKQLKRTPYITGFTAGWKTFALLNVHLHPGQSAADIAVRREEVSLLLQALAQKRKKKRLWSENIILVGDFNFYAGAAKDDATIQQIHDAGYREVESLVGVDTNASQTDAYDRMFLTGGEYFTLGQNQQGRESGGVFNPFEHVFREGEATTYADHMARHYGGTLDITEPALQQSYFKNHWRKNQLSDHFPIWIELIIDSSPVFLERTLQRLTQQL
jgi:endonuclease/exonuclease/phosphatase family metal-dependent hydrolase